MCVDSTMCGSMGLCPECSAVDEYEPCGDCGGEGFYCVPTDEDPMADQEHLCGACNGTGEARHA